jgi:hypothetical protein
MVFCDQGRVGASRSGWCRRPTTKSQHPWRGMWFMRALLHYYKVELHHLAPNSIS